MAMMYVCNQCGTKYTEEKKPQDERCEEEKCWGQKLTAYQESAGVIQGLCLLVCDISFSMDKTAFPNDEATKLRKVADAVQYAVTELGRGDDPISMPEAAFIGLIAFGARAALV